MRNIKYLIIILFAIQIWIFIYYGGFRTNYLKDKSGLGRSVFNKKNSKDKEKPLLSVCKAYQMGNYKEAEKEALRIIDSAKGTKDKEQLQESARARYIMAFSTARRRDMKLSRERFAVLRIEASKLPNDNGLNDDPKIAEPSLQEDAAYQHAVCTAALGNKDAAETEYMQFMRDFPESQLMNGVIQRLTRLHNGHLPDTAEKAWESAQGIARARQEARQRDMSLCGPACLFELLRRQGKNVDIETLAKEMKTDSHGTSLKSLADVAERNGFTCKGLKLTHKGLLKQSLPIITLITSNHYVIVDEISWRRVKVWDGNANGSASFLNSS